VMRVRRIKACSARGWSSKGRTHSNFSLFSTQSCTHTRRCGGQLLHLHVSDGCVSCGFWSAISLLKKVPDGQKKVKIDIIS
jgi:hypothetical protein